MTCLLQNQATEMREGLRDAEPIPKGWEGEQADRRVDRRQSESGK